MHLRGIFPPIPTPLKDDEIFLEALRTNIEEWLTKPLAGLVVLGSNGEAPQLTDDEADRVIDTARGLVPPNRVLLAGTARESTAATIAATQRAAALGVDAVLVRTPGFFRQQMTTDALVDHYRAVADTSPVPILLYNFTAVTGVNLLPEAVERLAAHSNIVGVKESGGDVAQVAALVNRTPDDFAVLAGSATTFYPCRCVGARGGILALATVVPEACARLHELVAQGRHDEARVLQRELTPLAVSISSRFGVPGLKAALDLIGMYGGPPRPPLQPLPAAAIEEIRAQLHALHQLQ